MTNFSTPFQLFLVVSLFLLSVRPSAQTPITSVRIRQDMDRFRAQAGNARKVSAYQRGYGYRTGPSMRPRRPGQRNLGAYITYSALRREAVKWEVQSNGVYYVQIGIGTPATRVEAVFDTGSDFTWMKCNQNFDPAVSKSYKPLACNSKQCQQLKVQTCNSTTQTCPFEVGYDDGSSARGDFATETLSFFDSSTTLPNVPFGCGQSNKASGVFGLGRGSLSFMSQAQHTAFSYCLTNINSPGTSLLQLGSPATFNDAAFTTPMLRNSNSNLSSFYYLGLTGISVNRQVFPVPSLDPRTGHGGSIIDCGTAFTRIPQDVYNKVRDGFVKAATGLTSAPRSAPFDRCFSLATQRNASFPTVSFHFGSDVLPLSRESVMYPTGDSTCFAFAPTEGSYSLIGSYQQQGIRVSFDEDTSTIGFLPNKC